MIKTVDHVTINIKNREKSEKFYSEFLGLMRQQQIDMGDSLIIYYELPGGVRLELIDTYERKPDSTDEQCTPGCYRHLAFEVDSVEKCRKACQKFQIPVIMEPSVLEKLHCKVMLIRDPNGVEIEFVER